MGRAELLALVIKLLVLVIKVLKLIAPLALSLLAGTAPDAWADGQPLDRDQPAVDFTRLRGCCTDSVQVLGAREARPVTARVNGR